ncbi:hypothetical protein [Spirosoma sp. KUDC1026]|uniref:hypothetical protein n=1 Tax=Spirosoma sp. KUDC1026 TaxID=2745947 RepID=UPI00159BAC3D|nr:hypothetical protein [Spirosoma sp. KUDC1026]QKZ15192.1 hypothetical protein HU175_22225 [Spirosoma sp. KUDC1026]
MTRFNADGLRFTLPDSWDEVTLEQAFRLADGASVVHALCILSGKTEADFRPLQAPDLAGIVQEHLAFLSQTPDFKALPVPTTLTVSGKTIVPPTKLGAQTTIGQKWDIDHELESIGTDEETDLFAVAPALLSIYLSPLITGQPYTDIEEARTVLPALYALPCTELLPLAAFFLSSCQHPMLSGRVFLQPVPPRAIQPLKPLNSLRRACQRLIPTLPSWNWQKSSASPEKTLFNSPSTRR